MIERRLPELQGQGRALSQVLCQTAIGLLVSLALTPAIPAVAQDATRVAAGEAAWDKAGCLQCHGAAGEGGAAGEAAAGPSLQHLDMPREFLAETISCGRPGTEMPAWLDGAYTMTACFGLPKGPPPAGTTLTPVLSGGEIQALVDFLLAKIVRR